MWKISLKMMKQDKRMLVPAGIAIFVGTLFIASTLLFGNTLDSELRQSVSHSFAEANYAVASKTTGEYRLVKDLRLADIRAVKGVKGARPEIYAPVQISSSQTHKRSDSIAIAMAYPGSMMPLQLVQGNWPRNDAEIVLPKATAENLDLKLGDLVDLRTNMGMNQKNNNDSNLHLKLVGLNEDKYSTVSDGNGATVLSEGTLAQLIGEPASEGVNTYSTGSIYLSIDTANTSTMEQIKAILPDGFHLQTRAEFEDAMIEDLTGQASIITTFLLCFAVLAMLVAALVIANTFQVMVARQKRTLALLRTIGAKKQQVKANVLVQSGVLGLCASSLGSLAAIGIMAGVSHMGLNLGGLRMSLHATPSVVVVPVLFGTAITMLASLGSAVKATRVAPVEALRPSQVTDDKRSGLIRIISACALIVVGTAMAAWILFQAIQDSHGVKGTMLGGDKSSQALGIAVMGVAMIFIGILLCADRWLPWLLKGTGSLLSHIGPSSTLAAGNIARNPSRVAATGSALLIGVTLVTCLGTGATSAKQTLIEALDSRFSVDLEVSLPSKDQNLLEKIRKVQGVKEADVIPVYIGEIQSGKASENSTEKDPIAIFGLKKGQSQQLMNVSLETQLADSSNIIIPQRIVDKDDRVKVGRKVTTVRSAENASVSSNAEMKIVKGAFGGLSDDLGLYGVTLDGKEKNLGNPDHYEIWVKSVGIQSSANLFKDIREILNTTENAQVSGSIATKMIYDEVIDKLLLTLVALLAIAVVIALIGVANTLSLSVIERTKESATLRAIGMTKRQLKRSLTIEALLIAVCSTCVGLVLGTIFGWTGSYIVFESVGKVSLPVDWNLYAMIVVIAIIAAIAASLIPARKATKTPPVEALAEV